MPHGIQHKIFDKTCAPCTGLFLRARCDDAAQLAEVSRNQDYVKAEMGAEHLLVMRQVHGNTVIDADTLDDLSSEPEGDAAVSSRAGVALGIQTADCAPVLLACEETGVIGAAHCGWRSAAADILVYAVDAMRKKGAHAIQGIIGPTIYSVHYEVDPDFRVSILETAPEAAQLFQFVTGRNKYLFDLPGFVSQKLRNLDVPHSLSLCQDTYAMPDKLYSYRRDASLRTATCSKRLLSVITR